MSIPNPFLSCFDQEYLKTWLQQSCPTTATTTTTTTKTLRMSDIFLVMLILAYLNTGANSGNQSCRRGKQSFILFFPRQTTKCRMFCGISVICGFLRFHDVSGDLVLTVDTRHVYPCDFHEGDQISNPSAVENFDVENL